MLEQQDADILFLPEILGDFVVSLFETLDYFVVILPEQQDADILFLPEILGDFVVSLVEIIDYFAAT